MVTEQAYKEAAKKLGCDVATIKAVADVESKGAGFRSRADDVLEPVILFERHVFHRLSNGKYTLQNPDISHPTPGAYGTYAEQHARLQKAAALDRNAALQSASWGKFQIMGFNHQAAGFGRLQDFINAMYKGEDEHLKAFINFIQAQGLTQALVTHDWATFAKAYNGKNYASNQYDTKLSKAYQKYAGINH